MPTETQTREIARRYIIEQGATYYKQTLARHGVSLFTELPEHALDEIATIARAAEESGTTEPAFHELISQR